MFLSKGAEAQDGTAQPRAGRCPPLGGPAALQSTGSGHPGPGSQESTLLPIPLRTLPPPSARWSQRPLTPPQKFLQAPTRATCLAGTEIRAIKPHKIEVLEELALELSPECTHLLICPSGWCLLNLLRPGGRARLPSQDLEHSRVHLHLVLSRLPPGRDSGPEGTSGGHVGQGGLLPWATATSTTPPEAFPKPWFPWERKADPDCHENVPLQRAQGSPKCNLGMALGGPPGPISHLMSLVTHL